MPAWCSSIPWNGRPSEAGAAALIARAEALAAKGELRLACHLADYALEAAPRDKAVQAPSPRSTRRGQRPRPA
jgi:hypothetical protein